MVMFKQKGVWLILAALLMTACLSTTAFARTAPGTILPPPPKVMSQKELNANAWFIWTTNYGPWCNPQANSGGFWRSRAYSYIFGAGIYVGAEDDYGNKIVAVGYNPNNGAYEFGPVSLDTSYGGYLSDAGARVYLSTESADFGAWPVRDEKGKKIIKSRQDSYALYSDENPAFTTSGDKSLGVAVAQHSYAWNYADNNDIVFFYFKVHNISGRPLKNVYIGPGNDCDIGDETEGNDRTAFDYTRNLAMQFQSDPEPGWDKTGVVGIRYFESPINNTGATVTVTDNYFSHDILPDSALGMTAFKIFTIEQDPSTDEDRYLEMQGINYWNMLMDAYDEWGAITPGDKRFLMSSGPFNLAVGGMASTCIGVIGSLDTTVLKSASDVAQNIYDNNFQLATPPAAPTLTVTPCDKRVILSWDRKAEITPDPYWDGMIDTLDWYPYFPGSWEWLSPASKLLVDSFRVSIDSVVNDTTTIVIFKNVSTLDTTFVCVDTVYAFYNQKELYIQYDFQGCIIYRARTMIDLADPTRRQPLGGSYTNTDTELNPVTCSYPGGSGYYFDKKDGIQVVKDLDARLFMSPEGLISLPKYDTLGSDRGLIYTLIDSNVVNGFGWYYGISAYDYQNNVFFTHKCPTTLASNPTENAVYCAARTPLTDLNPATVAYTAGNSDVKVGGTLNYSYKQAVIPTQIKNDTFSLKWLPITKVLDADLTLRPNYHAEVHDMQWHTTDTVIGTDTTTIASVIDTVIATTNLLPAYSFAGDDPDGSYNGYSDDETPFGGVIFKPYMYYRPWLAAIDSVDITEGDAIIYPVDSIWTQLEGNINFMATTGYWQWRGSNYEIRWKDSTGQVGTNPNGSIVTATVWDITNNVEVPQEAGIGLKTDMTKSSWCFSPNANYCGRYIDSLFIGANASSNQGMYICGITLYFNKRNGGSLRRMTTLWSLRPRTGDVWTITSLGLGTPSEGETAIFITTPATQIATSADLLNGIKVVPNPYLVRHNWDVSKNYPNIHFTHLPAKCTIRIFNLAGDLVRVLNHESSYADNNGTEKWDLLTTFDKRPASGIYIYQIDAPGIGTKLGKFAIIK